MRCDLGAREIVASAAGIAHRRRWGVVDRRSPWLGLYASRPSVSVPSIDSLMLASHIVAF